MSTAVFEATFGRSVKPVLLGLGFREVRPPDGWIAPAKLLECDKRWFGASWDSREKYLEVALGGLFEFRDVLPRAIVRGHYHHNADCLDENVQDFLTNHLTRVGQEIPKALDQFEKRLASALEADRVPSEGATRKLRRVFADYVVRIGDPITLEEWIGSQVINLE